MAIAQPLFELLGRNATFFVAHGSSSISIITFVLVWFFIPPLLVLALVAGVSLIHRAAGRIVLAASVGILGAVALAQVIPGYNDWPPWAAAALLLVVTPVLAWLVHTREKPRDFFMVIGLLAPAVLLVFFFFTPVNDLVFADEVTTSGKGATNDHHVVLVIFDELSLAAIVTPEHEIDVARAPNFARLAETGTWYRQATTVAAGTSLAVPAILSGSMPGIDTNPTASQYPQNLFTALAPTHDLKVGETITRLCPAVLCETDLTDAPDSLYDDAAIVFLHTVLPIDLASRWLPSISEGWAGFGEDPTSAATEEAATEFRELVTSDVRLDHIARFNQFTSRLAAIDRPTLAYMHVLLPHAPFTFLSDGRLYNGNGGDGLGKGGIWVDDQQLIDVAAHAYLLQVEYVDALLGDLLDELETLGRLDDTLLVVTADHGLSVTAGSHRRLPDASTLSEVAQVPLLIRYPGQTRGEIDDRPVQTIDILPTIADVMGVTLADAIDGQSLLGDDWEAPIRAMAGVEEFDFASSLDLDGAIGMLDRAVPSGTVAADAYGIGAARSLVGKPVKSAELGPESRVEVDPMMQHLYSNIRLDGGFVPVRFLATVDGADRGAHIVIALNGVVAGSGIVTELLGSDGIAVMLDPETFAEGANTITAYELEDGRLRPVAVASASDFKLRFDDQGRLSEVTHDDRTWSSTSPGYRIRVGRWVAPAWRPSQLIGWAADVRAGSTWERLLLLDGNEVVNSFTERVERSGVADKFGESTRESGFRIYLDPSSASRVTELRIVALFADGGLEFHGGEVAPKRKAKRKKTRKKK